MRNLQLKGVKLPNAKTQNSWRIRIQIRGFLESRFFFLWQLLPPKHLFLSLPHLGGCYLLWWSPGLQSLPGASPSSTWHNSFRDLKLFNHACKCVHICMYLCMRHACMSRLQHSSSLSAQAIRLHRRAAGTLPTEPSFLSLWVNDKMVFLLKALTMIRWC